MLKTVASFYDPLGIMAPVLIEGKHLYRLAVDEKKGWDEEVSNELQVKWKKWIYGLKTVEVLTKYCTVFGRCDSCDSALFNGC